MWVQHLGIGKILQESKSSDWVICFLFVLLYLGQFSSYLYISIWSQPFKMEVF